MMARHLDWLVTSASQRIQRGLIHTTTTFPLFPILAVICLILLGIHHGEIEVESQSAHARTLSFSAYRSHASQGHCEHGPPLTNNGSSQPSDVGKESLKKNGGFSLLRAFIHLHLVLRTKHYRSICGTSKT